MLLTANWLLCSRANAYVISDDISTLPLKHEETETLRSDQILSCTIDMIYPLILSGIILYISGKKYIILSN